MTETDKFKQLVNFIIELIMGKAKVLKPKKRGRGTPKGSKNKPKISKYGLEALRKIKLEKLKAKRLKRLK